MKSVAVTGCVLVVLVLGGVIACERSAPSGALTPGSTTPTSPPPADAPASIAPATDTTAPTAPPSPNAAACATIVQRFHARRTSASGACSNDGDCGCFNGVDPEVGCGGVTDATSAKDLAAIEDDFHRSACTFASQCAAWQCQPKCTAGKCVR